MGKASKRHYIVRIEGIPGTWRTFGGGGAEADVTLDYDGGAEKPDMLGGVPEYEDISVTRTVDPVADAAWLEPLKRGISKVVRTVSQQPTDPNMIAVGKPTVFPACLLKGYTEVETDAASSDPAEVTLTWATTGPA